jgi:hypothetical protein
MARHVVAARILRLADKHCNYRITTRRSGRYVGLVQVGAATLLNAVNLCNQRFDIGVTDQQKPDLVNFLNTL